jgi:hypothetical protein
MSYGVSAALQAAVFGALQGDVDLSAEVSGAIFDAEPVGVLPSLYVSLGPETVRAAGDVTGGGAVHEFVISVVTDGAGFASAKHVAGLVHDRLQDADLALSRGVLVSLRFYKAKAARGETGTVRRIDLTFRARVDDA